jgi:hypothetical protein
MANTFLLLAATLAYMIFLTLPYVRCQAQDTQSETGNRNQGGEWVHRSVGIGLLPVRVGISYMKKTGILYCTKSQANVYNFWEKKGTYDTNYYYEIVVEDWCTNGSQTKCAFTVNHPETGSPFLTGHECEAGINPGRSDDYY